jgi:hypothetical protein
VRGSCHGIAADRLTAVSARTSSYFPTRARLSSTAGCFVSCAGSVHVRGKATTPLLLLRNHQWRRPFDHRRFQLCAPPSMDLGKPRPLPFIRGAAAAVASYQSRAANATFQGHNDRTLAIQEDPRCQRFFVLGREEEGTATQKGVEPALHEHGDCAGLYDQNASVGLRDVHLPGGWHLNARRVPVPPVPRRGQER